MRLRNLIPAVLAAFVAAVPAFAQEAATAATPTLDTGNTAWLLVSSALVMLMTPGLAFFYAGMVSRKNVVSTLLQNFVALAVIGILWVVIGYSLVFTEGNSFIGGTSNAMLSGLMNTIYAPASVPAYAFVAFQMMFAIITPALITGAIAERVRFAPWLWFMGLWSLVVYAPVAHWVWGPDGWLFAKGGLDFAGGLVVHMTAGCSAFVAALLYGKRYNRTLVAPNDVSMIMLGAALLWFGWFGFNAGSALTSGTLAAHAFMTTFIGAAAAFVAWMATDWIRIGKPTAVGGAIGLVVGLVCITPAAGFVDIPAAIMMCAFAGVVCNLVAVALKKWSRMDDTLDVFACHGVGGMIGALATGCFASTAVNPAVTSQGLFIDGTTKLFMANATGVVAVFAYSMIATFVILKLIGFVMPIRTTETEELSGLDQTMHGENAKHHDRTHIAI